MEQEKKEVSVIVKKPFLYSFSLTDQRIVKEKEKIKIEKRFLKGLLKEGLVEKRAF